MNTLLEFIKRFYYWILFIVLEAISFTLLFQYNSFQGSVWFTSANSFVGDINSGYAEIMSFLELKDINATLTRKNLFLENEVIALREALDRKNAKASINDSVIADSLKNYTLIPAKVVSNSLHKDNNHIIINKGEADGIHTDMGVVGGGGVVGIVFLTGPHYSLVLPVINTKSNISCRVRHSKYFGGLQWYGGGRPNYAYLTEIPHYAKIKKGTFIETSGYSSVFPPGIFVGKVSEVSGSSDGLSLQLKVNLGTNFAKLDDVYVICNNDKPQIDKLQKEFEQRENSEE